MRIYECSGHLFTVTQRKVSVIKHRCVFSFHTQLVLLAGIPAESRDGRTAAVADFEFYIQLLFLHTNAIDETALWISELSTFAHNQFFVFKRRESHTTITV